MTVKAKRAKALPLLDADTALATGELVDESISADAEALINSLNGQFDDELLSWFRSRIGTFRAMHELPATHEELRSAKDAQLYLQESMLRLENLPPDAAATMEKHCWSRNQRVFNGPAGLLAEFVAIADEIASLLAATEETLKNRPVMRGRKPTSSRDLLLADVAAHLIAHSTSKKRTTKRRAAEVARDLLAVAGVDVPDDLYQVEKLIRRKKSGEK
jgi:hypothetical protein